MIASQKEKRKKKRTCKLYRAHISFLCTQYVSFFLIQRTFFSSLEPELMKWTHVFV